jgi:hypothetical protein
MHPAAFIFMREGPPSDIVQRVQVEAALCAEFGEALFKIGNAATIRIAQKIPEAGLGPTGLGDHEHIREILSPAWRFREMRERVGNVDEGDSHALGSLRRSGRVRGSGL